jgi:hypothetical protein
MYTRTPHAHTHTHTHTQVDGDTHLWPLVACTLFSVYLLHRHLGIVLWWYCAALPLHANVFTWD